MSAQTSTEVKAQILGTLWFSYREHGDLEDFIDYNDLGLPMAYALAEELVSITPTGQIYLDETWELLMSALEITDTGFEDLASVFKAGSEVKDVE